MKIKLYFEKENLIRLAVAVVFAAVLFAVIRFPVWVLFGFGVLYFGIKSLKIELNEKLSWLWSAIMLGTGGIFTAYHIQYLLLDAELRAKISDNKMLLNVLCCLVVFLAVQVFTNNTGLTCLISHIVLLSLAGINYFVYLFRGNEFIFSDLKSIQTGLSVAGNYEFALDERAGYVILLSTLYIAFIRKLHVSFQKRIPMLIVCISLAVLCCAYIGKHTQGVVTETWEQKGSYRNGYILNFVLSIRDCFIAQPDGYSKEAVKELEDQYSKETDTATGETEKKPTIIVVMSESYADLSVVGEFFNQYRSDTVLRFTGGKYDQGACALFRVWRQNTKLRVGIFDGKFHGISAERFGCLSAVYHGYTDFSGVKSEKYRLHLCGNASLL